MQSYRMELIKLLWRRKSSETFEFCLFGIFAGLLLSGSIPRVPQLYLGIGCAICATTSLIAALAYSRRLEQLESRSM